MYFFRYKDFTFEASSPDELVLLIERLLKVYNNSEITILLGVSLKTVQRARELIGLPRGQLSLLGLISLLDKYSQKQRKTIQPLLASLKCRIEDKEGDRHEAR